MNLLTAFIDCTTYLFFLNKSVRISALNANEMMQREIMAKRPNPGNLDNI